MTGWYASNSICLCVYVQAYMCQIASHGSSSTCMYQLYFSEGTKEELQFTERYRPDRLALEEIALLLLPLLAQNSVSIL